MTPTNPLFLKTGLLKLNEMFDSQVCKLMQCTMTLFNVDHSSCTPVYLVHLHGKKISKGFNFEVEK